MENRYYLYDSVDGSLIGTDTDALIYFITEDEAKIFLRSSLFQHWGCDVGDITVLGAVESDYADCAKVNGVEWLRAMYKEVSEDANEFYDALTEMGMEV